MKHRKYPFDSIGAARECRNEAINLMARFKEQPLMLEEIRNSAVYWQKTINRIKYGDLYE